MDLKTGVDTILHAFQSGADGATPRTALTAFDGKLYGVTAMGGMNGGGVVFSVDPASQAESVVAPLPFPLNSFSRLVAFNGLLYGTGYYCGGSGTSCIFSVDPTTGAFTVAYQFSSGNKDGKYPGSLIQRGSYLYGTAYAGGHQHGGTLFRFDPANGSFKVVHYFGASGDGASPTESLTEYGNLLYGATHLGGTTNDGTVFSYDPTTQTETVLHSFSGTDGTVPESGLRETGGLLYGGTYGGGTSGEGVIYSIDPSSGQTQTLHDFTTGDRSRQQATFVLANGLLFGANEVGGSVGAGQIFSLNPTTGQFISTHEFGGAPDYHVPSALTQVGAVYYGVSDNSGSNALGTIIKFSPSSGAVETVYSFRGTDGANPEAALLNVAGTLYGTTHTGGDNDYGTIFSFDPATHALTTLYSFDGKVGHSPGHALTLLGNTLYSTTDTISPGDVPTLFKLDLGTLKAGKVLSFGRGIYVSGLVSDGTNLFGTTQNGASVLGSIFQVDPASKNLTTLYAFTGGADGEDPVGDLFYSSGYLYGSTWGYSTAPATLFDYNLGAGIYTVLHSLKTTTQITSAMVPKGSKLYGTISYAANAKYGGVFSLNPATGHTTVFPFQSGGPTNPGAALVAANGGLFGTAPASGSSNAGTIFKFVP